MTYRTLIGQFSELLGTDPQRAEDILVHQLRPKNARRDQVSAFVGICIQMGLNPLNREIACWIDRHQRLVTVICIDGWIKIAQRESTYKGYTYSYVHGSNGEIVSCTVNVRRSDWPDLASATEFMAECKLDTDCWQKWPARMLRHRAFAQAIRLAYGVSGYLPEEAEAFSTPLLAA